MASEGLFREFYRVVKAIPRGKVANYGQVALLAGHPRAARFVGYALHSNPEPGVIPCHRVVFKDGSLASGFAFGGPDVQRRLLENEGVTFLPDGRVDLQECQWECFNRFATASLSIVPSPSVTKSAAYLVFSKQAALRLEQ